MAKLKSPKNQSTLLPKLPINGKTLRKPPLGVMPLRIHRDHRIVELSRAIMEYVEYGVGPNLVFWGKELLGLLEDRNEGVRSNVRLNT